MRKSLIMLIILLLLIVVSIMLISSLKIGGFEILGLARLNEENKKLDASIQTLSALSSTGYEKALSEVKNSAKQYKSAKENYEELATISTDGSVSAANQLQKYEIEYLWTRIGAHATKENVVLKMNVSANSSSDATGYYDLDFAVSGSYVALIDFIYDIENDSTLGFKIENFKMTSGSVTFKCTNIAINIDPDEFTTSDENSDENTSTEDTSNSNTTATNSTDTNTTNTNTTTNTSTTTNTTE